MQNEINTKRIEWIDTAKFIGIFRLCEILSVNS